MIGSCSEIVNEYEKFSPFYDSIAKKRNHYTSQIDFLLQVLENIEPNFTILDASCATGNVIHSLSRHYKNNQFYGIDICPSFIEKAKLRKNSRVEYIICDWSKIDSAFTNTHFDFIYILGNSLFHCDSITDLHNVLSVIYNKLSYDGHFLFDYRDWKQNKKLNRFNGLNKGNKIKLENGLLYHTYYRYEDKIHHLEHRIFEQFSTSLITTINLKFLDISQQEIESVVRKVGFIIEKSSAMSESYPFKTILLKKCK